MSDVSAIVLSVGEPSTSRAVASLAAQTLAPHQVILVEHVSPFFRAMNAGVRQVSTPFFVQVDADMILDPTCLASLRSVVRDDTGVSVGQLRDPLLGQVVGVKLFRTECFRNAGFTDSISPDTDFIAAIRRRGWKTETFRDTDSALLPPTVGEHRPDYTPAYTFRKHLLEGSRYRYRGARQGLRWRVGRLEESTHEMALLAQIALAHGFFLPGERDDLTPGPDDPRAAKLVALLGSGARTDPERAGLLPLPPGDRLRDLFRRFTRGGRDFANAGTGAGLREVLAGLAGVERDWRVLVAKLGFGHGLLTASGSPTSPTKEERALEIFLTLGKGGRPGPGRLLLARAARRIRGLRISGERLQW